MSAAACPRCGAPRAVNIDGLCASCLMLLVQGDDSAEEIDETLIEAAGAAAVDPRGQRIGHYELIEEIARGGMGIVYRAKQLSAERVVALKLMLPHLLPLKAMVERFRREVEAAARLDHRGILPIYDVGEHKGLPYYSMKLATGSLDRRVQEFHGQWARIAKLIADVSRAMEQAHERGVLHRDLKPANILFDAGGEPMVADFGVAKLRSPNQLLTLPATAIGSPHYMAPEQVSAQFGEVGPASDIYSIGSMLYELLTGVPPLSGDDAFETMRMLPTHKVLPGVTIRADVPPELDAIALRCLEKNPRDRFASAADLAADLEHYVAGRQVGALRQARHRSVRKYSLYGIAGLAALGLSLALGTRWLNGGSDAAPGASPELAAPTARSIAVLPFRNLTGRSDYDYLGASVTDDLLRELRQVDSLRVVPFRISVGSSQFKPEELSTKLGVDVVLEGDYTGDGKTLNVRSRLWDARTGNVIKEDAFDAPVADPRELRSQIATALVTRLQIEVGNDVRTQLSRDQLSVDPKAYNDYLRARYLLRWRREETLAEAAKLLRSAIAIEPGYARAYSALSYVYGLWIGAPPPEGDHWKLAVEFANETISMDPTLAEPHAVLADYYSIAGNYAEAEVHFQKASELDPRDPSTLHLYAIHLYSMGRAQAALDMERRSVALDSTSPQPMMWLAMFTTVLGDREEARQLWQKADDLGAARPLCAAVARLDMGEPQHLEEWYRTNFAKRGVPAEYRDESALLAGVVDPVKRAPALAWLKKVEPSVDPAFALTHYALLEDRDSFFRLAKDYALDKDFAYLYQLCNIWAPRTASVRQDARFGEQMQRWGFDEYWKRFGPADACTGEGAGLRCR